MEKEKCVLLGHLSQPSDETDTLLKTKLNQTVIVIVDVA